MPVLVGIWRDRWRWQSWQTFFTTVWICLKTYNYHFPGCFLWVWNLIFQRMWCSEKHKNWGLILSNINNLMNSGILLDKPFIFWWKSIGELSNSTFIPIPLWVMSIKKITISWPSILHCSFWCFMIKFISFTFTFLTSCACYWITYTNYFTLIVVFC